METAGVGAWRAVNAVTLPLSIVLGAFVAVPAWHAVREEGGLGAVRSAAALLIPVAVSLTVVGGIVLAALYVAFR